MSRNPYAAPKRTGPEDHAGGKPRVRRISFWLGFVELLIGTYFAYVGCAYGWMAGDSLSNVFGTFAIFGGLIAFILPGALLCSGVRGSWAGQILTLACVVLYVSSISLGSSGP